MPEDLSEWPAEGIAAICLRRGIIELSSFGTAAPDRPAEQVALNLLVEFASGLHVPFADLMDIQDELAAVVQRRVFLVPRIGLGAAFDAETQAQMRVIYRRPSP